MALFSCPTVAEGGKADHQTRQGTCRRAAKTLGLGGPSFAHVTSFCPNDPLRLSLARETKRLVGLGLNPGPEAACPPH